MWHKIVNINFLHDNLSAIREGTHFHGVSGGGGGGGGGGGQGTR